MARRIYTEEFKREAVRLVTREGYSRKRAAEAVGVCHTTIRDWVAATQAVLMTVYRTLKLRGLDPRQVIADALTGYAATGTLPSMPGGVEGG
jgi:transposase